MSMTAQQRDRALQTQTAIARKVFAAVPAAETWEPKRIARELMRTGHNVEEATVSGCLNTLVDAGLVIVKGNRELRGFQRCPLRPLPITQPADSHAFAEVAQPTSNSHDALLDRMGAIAASLRRHSKEAHALAAEIEDLAIAAQQQVESAGADGAKLRQLQTIMRDVLGGGKP